MSDKSPAAENLTDTPKPTREQRPHVVKPEEPPFAGPQAAEAAKQQPIPAPQPDADVVAAPAKRRGRQDKMSTKASVAKPDTKQAPKGTENAPEVVPPRFEKGLAQDRITNAEQAQDAKARKIKGLKGKRRDEGIDPVSAKPGDYWHSDFHWYGCLPNGAVTRLDDKASVIEHADGTISVEPSLDVNPAIGWQGDLRLGVWVHQ